MGSAHISVVDVWKILYHQLPFIGGSIMPDWPVSSEQIILKARLPRIILAALVGACLALAGAGFQGVLRNTLADPYTLGVASGAAVGAAFLILFGLQLAVAGRWSIPVVAFATGMLTLIIVLRLASSNRQVPAGDAHFVGRYRAGFSWLARLLHGDAVQSDCE